MPPAQSLPNPNLPCASRAAELLYAVGVHGRAGAPVPQIAAARAERVRALDPDIAGVERKGIAAFDAVPLEGLQEELRHRCIAVVRIEYINVLRPKPGTSYILLAARSVQSSISSKSACVVRCLKLCCE